MQHVPLFGRQAAKVGRNYTINNGVTHLTSKTLFESQNWKKWEQAAKNWQKFGIVEPVRTTKLKKKEKMGRGACQWSHKFEQHTAFW